MNENAYRARAERGEIQIGTWVTMIRSPAVLTLLKAAGLDFARIDMEHSPFSIETVADLASVARAIAFPLPVRAARRAWDVRVRPAHRVPEPADQRAHGRRDTRVHVTIMLETKRAFTRLDEIAAVPGIDALTIGPTDLAQDLGVLGTPGQRQVLDEHRRRLVTAARKHGKAVAMLTDSAEGVRQMISLGATIINYSSDAAVLRAGYAATVEEIRRALPTRS